MAEVQKEEKKQEHQQAKLLKSTSLPKLSREKYRQNKIYRAPPTPPLARQDEVEKSFILDCIAVGNISQDYSRANPKLGSVIPPYDSLNDSAISNYVNFYGVKKYLKETNQLPEHESIAGKVHDRFFTSGVGYRYLERRNQYGCGRHPETADGHTRFMGEQTRVMFSYNNMFGYRRNIPKLRTEPPSTFSVDPRWFSRISRTYGEHFTEDELVDHFKNTYVIGYPFYDNNYNNFHPMVKYIIKVKTGEQSPEEFTGNLGINIIARNFDTGFIQLDESIHKQGSQKFSSKKDKKTNEKEDKKLFKRNREDTFEFEDLDIRTISAIILSHDAPGEKSLYLEYVDVEIHRANEKLFYRFPFEGWVRTARQDKKTEELKMRFGKKNSIISYPNEKPKYEYSIIISPPTSKDTEYVIKVNYDIKKADAIVNYTVEFTSELPKTGKLIIQLNGIMGESEAFNFNSKTASIEPNKPIYKVSNRDIGELKLATIMYDDSEKPELSIKNFKVTDSDGNNYLFEIDQALKANKMKSVPAKLTSTEPKESKSEQDGALFIKLENQNDSTNLFELKNPFENKNGVKSFKRMESFIGNILRARFRFEGRQDLFCRIKSVKITSNKGQEFSYDRPLILRNNEETSVNDRTKNKKTVHGEVKKPGTLHVQIIGDMLKTDLFELKDPISDDDNLDKFSKTDYNLGQIKNVLLKYENKSNNQVNVKYVEIIDPRGNSFKFVVDMMLKNGDSVMLPRKSPGKTQNNDDETPKKQDKKEPKAVTPPPTQPASTNLPAMIDYQITIKKGIGAQSVPMTMVIYGQSAQTGKLSLVPKEEMSLINIDKSDEFTKKDLDVGKIEKITLSYEAKSLLGGCFLDSVEIKMKNEVVKFPIDRALVSEEVLELKPGVKPSKGGIDVKGGASNATKTITPKAFGL